MFGAVIKVLITLTTALIITVSEFQQWLWRDVLMETEGHSIFSNRMDGVTEMDGHRDLFLWILSRFVVFNPLD